MGVLSDLLQKRFEIRTRNVENPLVAAVGLAVVAVLPNDPDRVSFVIINLSANVIYLSPLPTVTANAGIRIDPNGGWRSFTWDEDFELVSHDWYAIATGAASPIFITQNLGMH